MTAQHPTIFPYEIKFGDSLFALAKQSNTPVSDIILANPSIDPNNLMIGQVVYLPLTGPVAVAYLQGGPLRPQIQGSVLFFAVPGGTWVCAEVNGLPPYQPATNQEAPIGPHGFHIHEFGTCQVGDPQNPFQAAGSHWNPAHTPHGHHAGDFPVLFSNQGYAKMNFFTNKFSPWQALGKSVIIHLNPDDYRTQPAGDSGKRLACGVIREA